MNFTEFQATGRDVPDLRAFAHIAAQFEDVDSPAPGRVYVDGLYIEGTAGTYCLTIGNHSEASADLSRMERQLFDFAISEGYIEGAL